MSLALDRPNACFGRLAWSDIVPTVVCRPEPHNRPIIHPDEVRLGLEVKLGLG